MVFYPFFFVRFLNKEQYQVAIKAAYFSTIIFILHGCITMLIVCCVPKTIKEVMKFLGEKMKVSFFVVNGTLMKI